MLAADEKKITVPDGLSAESLETVYNAIQLLLSVDESNENSDENLEVNIETTDEKLVQEEP